MADQRGKICFESGDATIDASLVAEGLRLNPEAVPGMIGDGTITCAFELGIDDDVGKFRLTFCHGGQTFRVVVDGEGHVLQRLRIDYGGLSTPQSRATSQRVGSGRGDPPATTMPVLAPVHFLGHRFTVGVSPLPDGQIRPLLPFRRTSK